MKKFLDGQRLGLVFAFSLFVNIAFGSFCQQRLSAEWAPVSVEAPREVGNERVEWVVLVDAYSSAYLFVEALHQRGFTNIIHVRSEMDMPAALTDGFDAGERLARQEGRVTFRHKIQHRVPFWRGRDQSLAITAGKIKKIVGDAPFQVMVGTETGVRLADELSTYFGQRGNDAGTFHHRRNKFFQQETIRKAGLRSIRQHKSMFGKSIQTWYDLFTAETGKKKVVLKPLESAGTDGVFICESAAQVADAFESITGRKIDEDSAPRSGIFERVRNVFRPKTKRNLLGVENREVLIQEFIEGTEYVVNLVGRDGSFVVSDLWRYLKVPMKKGSSSAMVYRYDELLSGSGALQDRLVEYAIQVAKALGHENGCAHIELMVTPEGDIVLIENNSRVPGTYMPKVAKHAIGRGSVDLTISAFLDPQAFYEESQIQQTQPYLLYRHARNVNLIAHEEVVMPQAFIDAVNDLESAWMLKLPPAGTRVEATIDLFTSPGVVFLANEDAEALERDYQEVVRLESLYLRSDNPK